jgi:hypothetical protein
MLVEDVFYQTHFFQAAPRICAAERAPCIGGGPANPTGYIRWRLEVARV